MNRAIKELTLLIKEEMQKEDITLREEDLGIIICILLRVISDVEVYDMILCLDTEDTESEV